LRKIDIEGYEEIMLRFLAKDLKPTIMEIHGQQLIDKFIMRGWQVMKREEISGCLGMVCNYDYRN